MAILIWMMVSLAPWHFTVLVADRFCGGIVGALIAGVVGGHATGFLLPAPGIPAANPPGVAEALWAMPGATLALMASYVSALGCGASGRRLRGRTRRPTANATRSPDDRRQELVAVGIRAPRGAQVPCPITVAPGWGSTVNFAEDRRQMSSSAGWIAARSSRWHATASGPIGQAIHARRRRSVGLNVRCSVGLGPIAASRPPYETPWRDG
jgi:hypothetical protein